MMSSLRFIVIVVGTLLCGVQICLGVDHTDKFKDHCPVSDNEAILANVLRTWDNFGKLLAESIQSQQSNGADEQVTGTMCRNQGILKTFLDDVSKALDPCFHGDMKRTKTIMFDNIKAALALALGLACEDDGGRFEAFIKHGVPCLFENKAEVLACLETTIGKFMKKACTGAKCTNSEDEETACREMNNLKTCLANILRKCEVESSADFVEGFIHTVMKSRKCDKYTGLNGSGSIVQTLTQTVISTSIAFVTGALL